MKRLLITILALGSLASTAGTISNKSNSKELMMNCSKYLDDTCVEFAVILKDNKKDFEQTLAKVSTRSLPSNPDQIGLSSRVKEFKYFPLSTLAYGPNSDIADLGSQVMGVGVGVIMLGAIEASIMPMGLGLLGLGVFVIASPAIADTVSMPVRLLIKGNQYRKANMNEKLAFNALQFFLSETENEEMSNAKFNKVVKAFKQIVKI